MSRKKKTEADAPAADVPAEAEPIAINPDNRSVTYEATGRIIIRRDPSTNRLLCHWEGGSIIRCYDEFVNTLPKYLGGLDGDTLRIGQFTMRVIGRDDTGVFAERVDENKG